MYHIDLKTKFARDIYVHHSHGVIINRNRNSLCYSVYQWVTILIYEHNNISNHKRRDEHAGYQNYRAVLSQSHRSDQTEMKVTVLVGSHFRFI